MHMPPHRHRLMHSYSYALMDLFEHNMNKTPVLAEPIIVCYKCIKGTRFNLMAS